MTTKPEPVTASDDQVLAAMISEAELVTEPGTLIPGTVLEHGDDSTPPTVVRSVASAGYVRIYDRLTGEESITNRNMLIPQLRKKRPDGSPVFTHKPPRDKNGQIITPLRGTQKCPLHAANAWRAQYDELGFPVCRKENLRNAHQVTLHMRKKHPQEYQTILSMEEKADKERTRRFQEALLASAQKASERGEPPTLKNIPPEVDDAVLDTERTWEQAIQDRQSQDGETGRVFQD